jgi:DHA1 family bicyclomycin/chloramphenicol resistance-like MFS transporter
MQARSRQFYIFVIILGSLSAFGPLSIDMYLPAFPAMAESLGVTQGRIEMSLASYFIGLSLGQLVYGPLTDRYGRKKPLYVGLLLYILASAACALAANSEQLIFFRFVQALGGCAGAVVSRAMVRDLFDHKESAQVYSALMLVMGLAPILAPLAGGYALIFFGWRSIFWILAGLSILISVAIVFFLPETRKPDETVRFSRSFHTYFDIMKHREFMGYTLCLAVAQAGLFTYITGSSFVFIKYFGVAEENFGWIFGSCALAFVAMSQLNAYLLRKDKQTPDDMMRKALIGLAAAGVFAAVVAMLDLGLWVMMATLFFFMAMLGAIFPNGTAGAMEHQKHRAGAASALAGMLQFSLSAAASAVLSLTHATSPVPMGIMLALSGLGACGIFIWMKNYRPPEICPAAPDATA